MTPEQREAVRSSAAFLREVRPIDPTELVDYVEGPVDAAEVRDALWDLAPELGLVGADGGRFVPVGDEPAPGLEGPVERLPADYARSLEAFLVDRYGADWATGSSGERLRETIRRLKSDYLRGRPVDYDVDVAAGYAVYHLPGYYAAIQYVLDDLAERDLLPRHARVLDVGAGVGGPALGLFDLFPEDALVDYHGVEPGPAADVFERFDPGGPNVHRHLYRTTAEEFDPVEVGGQDGWDLILFANVLSELDDPTTVIERYAGALAPDGAVVALAPADRETSANLRVVERAAVDGLGVYSPTVRLWPGHEPTDRCWSFDVRPDLEVPAFQRTLDAAAGATGEFVNVDVQFAYAVLRADGATRIDYHPDPTRYARLADSESALTRRVDCVGVKLSRDLADDGHPVFLVGDGSQAVDHFAVLVNETPHNRALGVADYGDLLAFEGVLVLWNDDEAAVNLVVDDGTVVDRRG